MSLCETMTSEDEQGVHSGRASRQVKTCEDFSFVLDNCQFWLRRICTPSLQVLAVSLPDATAAFESEERVWLHLAAPCCTWKYTLLAFCPCDFVSSCTLVLYIVVQVCNYNRLLQACKPTIERLTRQQQATTQSPDSSCLLSNLKHKRNYGWLWAALAFGPLWA